MKIVSIRLYKISLPLRFFFTTSTGQLTTKDFILLSLTDEDGHTGYGECSAFPTPFYTEEFRDSAFLLLKDQLLPALLNQSIKSPQQLQDLFRPIRRNNMAKAAVDTAIWDLFAKQNHQSLAKAIGGNKSLVTAGISIGIQPSPNKLVEKVRNYLQAGYQRIKVKIKPGADYQYLKAVRNEFPDIMLMADANSAYRLADTDKLKQLDELHLLMIEQPLEADDLLHHAQLQQQLATPLCLDESINSLADAQAMYQLGSGKIINIKVSKVGGLTTANKIQEFAQTHQLNCWCGGMLGSGVARAADIAVATLPGFTLPNDISASQRYFNHDIIKPEIDLTNGKIKVPTAPGIGYDLNWDIIRRYTTEKVTL
ncbi:o-succinylbenzoate synthase [Limosilactobacillus sp. STM2_1]|uniref:o-succinylbenzoate synthase n=1 Tax=Limosilactobacillus rudii TaxID=2759755 RepID=A0A7W3UJ99_9LACO|nr:o-succinylbenzoate synthase [Limosilactobacillus rudii]MBB1078404.1 o-succinylbenzoate synthase [Limosilactobacillus rudii]MBB1096534.1 o-succinylbenzoate synthase [Limosilactobacillus rudii]MCD7134269.1 o-succinylbenzoate synthase [Limosilactobacillus rudii]